ncbi:MAG: glycoside hydrolase family 95 protein [Porphyromonas sp.]|nr:glycoside hydrolase family 95 protein [Porphyromonas sp.]
MNVIVRLLGGRSLYLLFFFVALNTAVASSKHYYYFTSPAKVWEEQLPLGNGRIGLMTDSRLSHETITLNEISMWSGSKENTDNPKALESLQEIRRLLFAGENKKAEDLVYRTFVCGGKGSNYGRGDTAPYGSYQLFGRLHLHHYGIEPKHTGYKRALDIDNAIAETSFSSGGVVYSRKYYTSFADDVAVIELTASEREKISFDLAWSRPQNASFRLTKDGAVIEGALPDGTGGYGNKFFGEARIVLPEGGTIFPNNGALEVRQATSVLILVAMNTSYGGVKEKERVGKKLDEVVAKATLNLLRESHIKTFRQKFGQTAELSLGEHPNEKLPMPERLRLFHENREDLPLVALYQKFGLYLLVSSTREGGLPPNLQGLWANSIATPWNGDYHLNINLQMNYWPAEIGNLSSLHRTLADWTLDQVESGKRTAKVFYGASGWVTHILGNVWQFTAPGEHPSWGATNTSAAWLCQHLFRHYRYNPDKEYLHEVFPAMLEASRFFVDMLVKDPRNGYLVTAPTTSPENSYYTSQGEAVHISAGSTMDNQIIRELFGNTIEAARILGIKDPLLKSMAQKVDSLMPTTIGEDGRIMEWLEPYKEAEPHHRHVSHLYGLYPGYEISSEHTPELAAAAKKSLDARGDVSTSWSMAWKVNFWARLHEGDRAFKLISELLRPCSVKGMDYKGYNSGTLPNLFSAHPPFQIDGNFGGAAGIMEMLLQSESGVIEVIPALPTSWRKSGSFRNIKVVGDALVSAKWKDAKIVAFKLTASAPYTHKLKANKGLEMLRLQVNGKGSVKRKGGYWILNLKPGDIVFSC